MRVESAGHGIDAEFARALPLADGFDLARPVESLRRCMGSIDNAFVLEFTGEDPPGWSYRAQAGLEKLKGVAADVSCLGEQPDQRFTLGVLVPSYLQVVAADQPVVHRIAAVANNVFLSYRRLAIPMRAASGRSASHILALTQLEFVVPLIRPGRDAISRLAPRERQCLSMAASGLLTKQIAAEMRISEKTVEFHLAGARHKLGARTTTQAVAMALTEVTFGGEAECLIGEDADQPWYGNGGAG